MSNGERRKMIERVHEWTKIKPAAQYAGVSERTFRTWLNKGLKHTRLPSGTILIKYSWIDEFLEQFINQGNEIDRVANDIIKELKE